MPYYFFLGNFEIYFIVSPSSPLSLPLFLLTHVPKCCYSSLCFGFYMPIISISNLSCIPLPNNLPKRRSCPNLFKKINCIILKSLLCFITMLYQVMGESNFLVQISFFLFLISMIQISDQ